MWKPAGRVAQEGSQAVASTTQSPCWRRLRPLSLVVTAGASPVIGAETTAPQPACLKTERSPHHEARAQIASLDSPGQTLGSPRTAPGQSPDRP